MKCPICGKIMISAGEHGSRYGELKCACGFTFYYKGLKGYSQLSL